MRAYDIGMLATGNYFNTMPNVSFFSYFRNHFQHDNLCLMQLYYLVQLHSSLMATFPLMCLNVAVCFSPAGCLHSVAPGLLCGSDQERVHRAVHDMNCSHLRVGFCGDGELQNCPETT